MSHYRIATAVAGVAGLKDVDCVVDETGADPYPTSYLEFTESPALDLNGSPIEAGLPVATWHWDWLPQHDIAALQAYCSGASAAVYLRTRTNSGESYQWKTFSALMLRPTIGDMLRPSDGVTLFGLRRGPVDVRFVNLVEV